MANEYRVSQVAVEVVDNPVGSVRVTGYDMEVSYRGSPLAQVTAVGVEVLRSITSLSGRRRQIIN